VNGTHAENGGRVAVSPVREIRRLPRNNQRNWAISGWLLGVFCGERRLHRLGVF
jgi:hypothetical protein